MPLCLETKFSRRHKLWNRDRACYFQRSTVSRGWGHEASRTRMKLSHTLGEEVKSQYKTIRPIHGIRYVPSNLCRCTTWAITWSHPGVLWDCLTCSLCPSYLHCHSFPEWLFLVLNISVKILLFQASSPWTFNLKYIPVILPHRISFLSPMVPSL